MLRSAVILQKLAFAHLVYNDPVYYVARRFTAVFEEALMPHASCLVPRASWKGSEHNTIRLAEHALCFNSRHTTVTQNSSASFYSVKWGKHSKDTCRAKQRKTRR